MSAVLIYNVENNMNKDKIIECEEVPKHFLFLL